MFTGIIREVGEVLGVRREGRLISLTIQRKATATKDLRVGESIAVNGVCLTLTQVKERNFMVEVMPETLQKSNLGDLKVGGKVNLEKPLCLGEPLSGHIVQGHVDGVGRILKKVRVDGAVEVEIRAEPAVVKYLVLKGSVAVDGVSLTISKVTTGTFSVSLISHTLSTTTLGNKLVGERVNLEVDIIGKYVEKMIRRE